jgi:hypothetical protein
MHNDSVINNKVIINHKARTMEWQIYKALGVHTHENNVREHFYCIREIFELYNTKERLEELSKRPDLDTICAFDYHKMKTYALAG